MSLRHSDAWMVTTPFPFRNFVLFVQLLTVGGMVQEQKDDENVESLVECLNRGRALYC